MIVSPCSPIKWTSASGGRWSARRAARFCSVGLEFRDYPTLISAVAGLDLELVIAAASYWSKRGNTAEGMPLPANVRVTALDYERLRELYAQSLFVVVPLYNVEFQAGITVILEAMAMGKAVIVTQTRGQTDVVRARRWIASAARGASVGIC